jgi:3-phytase
MLAKHFAWATAFLSLVTAQNATIELQPIATDFDSDNAAFYYAQSPLLIGNDGSAADGGFRTFSTSNSTRFKEVSHQKTGRSKVVVPVYDVGGRDVIVNIPAPDSIFRAFEATDMKEITSARKNQLGDWSVARVWRSQISGENYIFLFGKKMVVQLLIRDRDDDVEFLEVSWTISFLLW